MKRCLVCGCVVEDGVTRCPQCGATKFEAISGDKEAWLASIMYATER